MNISTEEFMKILYAPLLEHADDFALSKLYLGPLDRMTHYAGRKNHADGLICHFTTLYRT